MVYRAGPQRVWFFDAGSEKEPKVTVRRGKLKASFFRWTAAVMAQVTN
jgi:hypothetical protein